MVSLSSLCHMCRHRFSAPPGPDRSSGGARDSVGSVDYLSESQMDSDDEESAHSEVSLLLFAGINFSDFRN